MIIKYFSIRKLRNLVLLRLSYHLSYLLKRNFRWGRYVSLSIEPTNACNLSCIECPTGTNSLKRKKGNFPLNAFREILDEKEKDLIYLNYYFQGEPFFNKETIRMIRMASDRNIYTSVSTNAQLITKDLAKDIVESGLNRIIISIDGTTQEVYEKYRRGGELEKVIQASKYLVEARQVFNNSKLKIVFQFLVFKHNEHQIKDIQKLGKNLGVDKVEIKSAQVYNYYNSKNITSINKYSRYKKDSNGNFQIKNKLNNKCWRMWHSVVITQDLDLVPCCYDKDALFKMGNLRTQKIIEIEASGNYKEFRQTILNKRSSVDMCLNCDEGLIL